MTKPIMAFVNRKLAIPGCPLMSIAATETYRNVNVYVHWEINITLAQNRADAKPK